MRKINKLIINMDTSMSVCFVILRADRGKGDASEGASPFNI